MRFIETKTHGYMDYLMGVVLIAAPWLFDFADNGAETWVPVILGASAIVYSLLTDYEMGLSRMISMRAHLWLDVASGIFLAASPWIFGFANQVYLPHLILGIVEVGAGLFTKTEPSRNRNLAGHNRTSTASAH